MLAVASATCQVDRRADRRRTAFAGHRARATFAACRPCTTASWRSSTTRGRTASRRSPCDVFAHQFDQLRRLSPVLPRPRPDARDRGGLAGDSAGADRRLQTRRPVLRRAGAHVSVQRHDAKGRRIARATWCPICASTSARPLAGLRRFVFPDVARMRMVSLIHRADDLPDSSLAQMVAWAMDAVRRRRQRATRSSRTASTSMR